MYIYIIGNRNEDDVDEIGFYQEDEDDYSSEDDHFENVSEEDNASYLEDEIKELENEAIIHNPQIQLRRSTRISSKNLENRMSWK